MGDIKFGEDKKGQNNNLAIFWSLVWIPPWFRSRGVLTKPRHLTRSVYPLLRLLIWNGKEQDVEERSWFKCE